MQINNKNISCKNETDSLRKSGSMRRWVK